MAQRRRHNDSTFRRGKITNSDMVVERLMELGEDVVMAAKIALAEGVESIVFDAKTRVPVRTGKLRNSIKAMDKNGDGTVYTLTADATNKKGIAYGQFVEFDPRINRPFLYPAIEANIRRLKRNIRQAVKDSVKYRGHYGNIAA